jgi:fructokinase
MASGPALEARFGRRAETLTDDDESRAVDLVAHYLASGVRSLTYALAPARVVIGGGVGLTPGLVDRARTSLLRQLAGYPGLPEHRAPDYLVTAALGDMAGPTGTLLLAASATA